VLDNENKPTSFYIELSLMIFFAKSIHFSDIYSKKCMIKMTIPEVCKQEKSDEHEAEVFYTVKMASQEDSEGNVLLQING
jgi:hypothetical protein